MTNLKYCWSKVFSLQSCALQRVRCRRFYWSSNCFSILVSLFLDSRRILFLSEGRGDERYLIHPVVCLKPLRSVFFFFFLHSIGCKNGLKNEGLNFCPLHYPRELSAPIERRTPESIIRRIVPVFSPLLKVLCVGLFSRAGRMRLGGVFGANLN